MTPAHRAESPRVRYHGRRGEHAGEYWPTRPVPARPPAWIATVTESCERPPVIAPCGLGKSVGRLISNRRFRIAQCLCHDEVPPDSSGWPKQDAQLAMAVIEQNLRGTANRITLNRQTPAIA